MSAFGLSFACERERWAVTPVARRQSKQARILTQRSRENHGGHGEAFYALRAVLNELPARGANTFLLCVVCAASLLLCVKSLLSGRIAPSSPDANAGADLAKANLPRLATLRFAAVELPAGEA
jgi:hypothetical protein